MSEVTMLSDWGRPTIGIFQTAFVVEDLDVAIAQFSSRFNVEPWAVFRDAEPTGELYRGEPARARLHLAFGLSGTMTYELVQLADDAPSVYRDVVEDRGYGFHHFGYGTATLDEAIASMNAEGYEAVANLDTNELRLAMFDTRDVLPGMTELIEVK
jgi:Glyoxalase/Bleomycin resistance protein/Dioxygenase superfamily